MSKILQVHEFEFHRAEQKARLAKRGTVRDASEANAQSVDHHLSNRWVGETDKCLSDESQDTVSEWFFSNLGLKIAVPEKMQPVTATCKDLIAEFEQFESFKQSFLDSRGNILDLLLKRNVNNEAAFIDQVTFTGSLESLSRRAHCDIDTVATISMAISSILIDIFGFGITSQTASRSNFFYEHVFHCEGTEKTLYAKVHFGGQHNTFCVEVKGLGVTAAADGWNKRLYDTLSADWFVRPKITRLDIAMDFFNNEYTPERARRDRNKGLFNSANKRIPKGKCQGTEWEDKSGTDKSGKTYEIGTRNSARFIRVYNKAAEQGVDGFWVRFEIEFGRTAIIPLDALAHPTAYFCGAVPVCSKFVKYQAKEVQTKQVKLACTIERQLKIFKRQAGRALNFFIEWFADLSPEQLIQRIKADHDLLPARLHPAAWSANDAELISFDKLTEFEVNQTLLLGF